MYDLRAILHICNNLKIRVFQENIIARICISMFSVFYVKKTHEVQIFFFFLNPENRVLKD